jgi:uncharacterized protein with HEPN domain
MVSEGSRRLPAELKERNPGIDWVAVAAAGNVYRHEYDGVDVDLIWHTAKRELIALRDVVAEELASLDNGD